MASKVVRSSGGFLCLACNCFLKLKSSMKRHLIEHHLESNVSFNCPVCQKRYKNKSTFKVHIYTRHQELKGMDYDRFAVDKFDANL